MTTEHHSDLPTSPDGSDDALETSYAETVAALRAIGASWRAEHAALVAGAERRVREALHAARAESSPASQTAAIARLQAESQARHGRVARGRAWARVAQVGALVVVVVALAAILSVSHWRPNFEPSTGPVSMAPPRSFEYNPGATIGMTTPQQAFAAGITLTPCVGGPQATPNRGGSASSTTVTWIVAGPNYGLARIQPVCDPPARPIHLWLFTYVRQGSVWVPGGGGIEEGNWYAGGDIAQPTPSVPAWLPLPQDTYAYTFVAAPQGNHPPASVVAWDAQKRLFVFGHVADRAMRPDGAASITVDGQAGWLVTENGLTTVTAVLPDGTTLFFSGTAAPEVINALAADAFAHASDALEDLAYPTITPSAGSGLGG